MPHSQTKLSAGLYFFLASAFSISSSASDTDIAASFHDDVAKGFCAPEFLAEAGAQFSRCKSAWESPVSLCANETGIYDYITSDGAPDDEWEARFEATSETFTECLFSKLQTASDSADNPDREIYKALLNYYGAHQELEETESELFTDDQVASGKLDEYFAEQAQVMNEGLPMMVDDLSRLEQVTYSDRVFREHYRIVGVTEDELQNEFSPDAVQRFFISNACNHKPSQNAMREGIEFAYEFRTEDGSKHTEVSVSSTDCEGLK